MFEEELKYCLDDKFIVQAAKDLSMQMHEAEEYGYQMTDKEDLLWEQLKSRILQKNKK